jgi:hypothetical protein
MTRETVLRGFGFVFENGRTRNWYMRNGERRWADDDSPVLDHDTIDHYIEIRGIYDGWSVAKLKDGTLVNRWPVDDRRHGPTQEWITTTRAQGGE